jgi:hypothetical protein
MPAPYHRSPIFIVFALLGVFVIFLLWIRAVHARKLPCFYLLLGGLVLWCGVQQQTYFLFNRYYDPMTLLFLALAFAETGSPIERLPQSAGRNHEVIGYIWLAVVSGGLMVIAQIQFYVNSHLHLWG